MPKAKPDRVEVIRIELQESERQILRDFVSVNTIGEVAQLFEGIDKLLTFENLYIGATVYEIITGLSENKHNYMSRNGILTRNGINIKISNIK